LESQRPFVLVAAVAVLDDADLAAAGVFPSWWNDFDTEARNRLEPEVESVGWREVESILLALPVDRAELRLTRMERWIASYQGVSEVAGLHDEFFAAAVAQTSETRRCFSRSDETIERLGASVGSSLASGEFLGLLRCTAALLSELPPDEEARMITTLKKCAAALEAEQTPN
jgi:hypothetical protein